MTTDTTESPKSHFDDVCRDVLSLVAGYLDCISLSLLNLTYPNTSFPVAGLTLDADTLLGGIGDVSLLGRGDQSQFFALLQQTSRFDNHGSMLPNWIGGCDDDKIDYNYERILISLIDAAICLAANSAQERLRQEIILMVDLINATRAFGIIHLPEPLDKLFQIPLMDGSDAVVTLMDLCAFQDEDERIILSQDEIDTKVNHWVGRHLADDSSFSESCPIDY